MDMRIGYCQSLLFKAKAESDMRIHVTAFILKAFNASWKIGSWLCLLFVLKQTFLLEVTFAIGKI
jgi:flagellar biosynthesis protein FliP